MTRSPWRRRKLETFAIGNKADDCWYGHNARAGCPCAAAARTCGRAESPGAAQLRSLSHAIQLALMGSEAQQYPWQIRAIQYAARLPQLVLVWRGASAYPARPFADYPRTVLGGGGTLETDFAQMSIGPPKGDSRPASAQRLQRDGAGGVNGSISLSSSPRAARQRPIWSHGTAPVTPRLGAPRPPSREHTPAHRSGGAATTPQCRPARVRPLKHLLLRPSNRRADLQPLRALPPRATSSALQTVPRASHTGLPCPWISFFCHCQGSEI